MPDYIDDIFASAAALNELLPLKLEEAVTFFELGGQISVLEFFWDEVRQHRIQAVQLRALNVAKRDPPRQAWLPWHKYYAVLSPGVLEIGP